MSSTERPPSSTVSNTGADTEPEAALRFFGLSAVGRFPRLRRAARGDELRRKLQRVIEAHATAAAERAVSGHGGERDAQRIDELQKLLAALPKVNDLYAAAVVAILCLLLACITLIHTPTTEFDLSVNTRAMQVRLADPLAWPALPIRPPAVPIADPRKKSQSQSTPAVTLISNVDHIDLPPEFKPSELLDSRVTLSMTGAGRATLTDLELDRGVVMTLTHDHSGAVDLRLLNRPPVEVRKVQGVQGNFAVAGPATLTATVAGVKRAVAELKDDESVDVAFSDDRGTDPKQARGGADPTLRGGTVPMTLRVYPADSITLPRLHIDQLTLKPDESTNLEGQASFTSAISTGGLVISDTGVIEDIKGADITFLGASGYISGLEIRPDGIAFDFEGAANKISIGPPGYTHDVHVSLLEHLYHQDKFKLLWALIVVLWGIAWGVRKMLAAR